MSRRVRVAVSLRVVDAVGYTEPRDALSHDWARRLDGLGALPLLVPNALAEPRGVLAELGAEALLLSNGDDLDPRSPRDRTERALLDEAIALRLPVLGVCRGFQLINDYFGGSAVAVEGHVGAPHAIALRDGAAGEANSFHRRGVTRAGLAAPLLSWAFAGEVVEAFAHRVLPIQAVQWHPERPAPPRQAEIDRALFAEWLGTAA